MVAHHQVGSEHLSKYLYLYYNPIQAWKKFTIPSKKLSIIPEYK